MNQYVVQLKLINYVNYILKKSQEFLILEILSLPKWRRMLKSRDSVGKLALGGKVKGVTLLSFAKNLRKMKRSEYSHRTL